MLWEMNESKLCCRHQVSTLQKQVKAVGGWQGEKVWNPHQIKKE